MTDEELIKYIWKLFLNDITDGDIPTQEEFNTVEAEFRKRGYLEDDEELIPY